MLQANVEKEREVLFAIACPLQTVESSASAQVHVHIGVLLGNG